MTIRAVYRKAFASAMAGCVGSLSANILLLRSASAEPVNNQPISQPDQGLTEPSWGLDTATVTLSGQHWALDSGREPAQAAAMLPPVWQRQSVESLTVGSAGAVQITPWPDSASLAPNLAPVLLTPGLSEPTPLGPMAQAPPAPPKPGTVPKEGSVILGQPEVRLQGVFKQEGNETSARGRVVVLDPLSPSSLLGVVVDLSTGNGFSDSPGTGLRLSELYYAVSPAGMPNLKFVGGLMDLTSYFDRNSFAKDGANHFFNRAFQTNPALAAAGLGSRVGLLANWDITDNVQVKAGTFSAARGLGNFALDSFVSEVGLRFGTAILRGTYISSKDAGRDTGFEEIFSIPRGSGSDVDYGLKRGDREQAVGVNGEFYIPKWKLGFFGRYGYYWNRAIEEGGQTFSVGATLLSIFMPKDRLGLAYGWQLTNDKLRREQGDKLPDVLELYYDFRISPNFRAAVSFQERNQFTETVLGVRVTTDFDISPWFRRLFR